MKHGSPTLPSVSPGDLEIQTPGLLIQPIVSETHMGKGTQHVFEFSNNSELG